MSNKKYNRYYHKDLIKFFNYNGLSENSVLEIACGNGKIIDMLGAAKGEVVDIIEKKLQIEKKFDNVVISDTLVLVNDIQSLFGELKRVVHENSRVIITYHNFLWQPFLKLAEFFHFKARQEKLNWLNRDDIINLLQIEGFDIIKTGNRFLFPFYIPIISALINRYLAPLPLLNKLCLTGYIIARPGYYSQSDIKLDTVSVIIPARNEEGNIENAVKRLPKMGQHTEIIFVEGGSSDGTLDEIKRVCESYKEKKDIKWTIQDGQGKGDAVRKGFSMVKGKVLMILDADLTVPPEDLPKFYEAIATGRGEYINGTRLVYPLEKDSMRYLNMLGNKLFSIMFSWLLGQRLKDTLCGTKVISKDNYEKLAASREYFGDFDPFGDFDLIFGAAKLNLKIVEIPIRYQARKYGSTNISRFRHGWLLIKMVVFAMNKIKFI